jgi:hypothetical protein
VGRRQAAQRSGRRHGKSLERAETAFLFRLAAHFGTLDVDALATLPSRVLNQWRQYEARYGFTAQIADLHGAQLATLYAESKRDRKRRSRPFELSEFTYHRPVKRRMTTADFEEYIANLKKTHGNHRHTRR